MSSETVQGSGKRKLVRREDSERGRKREEGRGIRGPEAMGGASRGRGGGPEHLRLARRRNRRPAHSRRPPRRVRSRRRTPTPAPPQNLPPVRAPNKARGAGVRLSAFRPSKADEFHGSYGVHPRPVPSSACQLLVQGQANGEPVKRIRPRCSPAQGTAVRRKLCEAGGTATWTRST